MRFAALDFVIEMERLGRKTLEVGWTGPAAEQVHPDADGMTVAQVAAKNHFGAPGVPARPALPITFQRRRAELAEIQAKAVAALSRGRKAAEVAGLVGAWASGAVQEEISNGIPPANAPATIARKGSSKPLIDTGLLRASISYKVE